MENLLNGPAAPAPPGLENNLVDPPSQQYLLVLSNVIFLACTTPMVGIRMYVNLTTSFRWDDVLVFLSWLLLIAYCILGLEMRKYGALVDIWNVRLGSVIRWTQLIYTEELLYLISIFAAKLSVLVLYKRIFVAKGKRNGVYYIIISVVVFNTLFYIISTIIQALICIPKSKIWNPTIPGHCLDTYSIIIGTAAVNVVSDLLIVAIPIAVVRRLQMSRKHKAEVYFIFGFGILCFASSIARLVYSVLARHDPNQTVALMKIGLWSAAEITSCLIASCVPMAPRLVRRVQKKAQSSQGTSRRYSPASPEQRSPPKSAGGSLWSKVSTLGQSQHGEDPYLITKASVDTDQETEATAVNESEVFVFDTVDVVSSSKPQIGPR